MKTLRYLFSLLVVAVAFTACKDEDLSPYIDYNGVNTPIGINTEQVQMHTFWTDTVAISTEMAANWRASSSASWCRIEHQPGTPSTKALNVITDLNRTYEARTATITFEYIHDTSVKKVVTITQPGKVKYAYTNENASAPEGMKKNAMFLLKQINVGWNLGNSFESDGDETAWGNPVTTRDMIKGVKAAGFNAIRIPVRWCVRADEKLNIKPEAMARIKEVVDWAIAEDMYVVLNSHHDQWYDRMDSTKYVDDVVNENFKQMWTQIAETFKSYDEHLIFAGMNEVIERVNGNENWGSYTEKTLKRQQTLAQIFVDAVRANGGNNAWRNLMIQPMAASADFALQSDFVMPKDNVKERLILEFHYYQPYSYAGGGATNGFWGSPYETLDGAYVNGESELADKMFYIQTKFVDNGYPCIMGEFGSVAHLEDLEHMNSQAYFLKNVVKSAKDHSFPAFLWDNNLQGSTDGENMGYLNRNDGMNPYFPMFIKGVMDGAAEGKYTY